MTDPLDLAEFLARWNRLPAGEAADAARADQQRRWRAGERVPAERYLAALPTVAADPEHALVLVYGEIVSRSELGETPLLTEYQRRFPHLAERLIEQFDLHRALNTAPAPTAVQGDPRADSPPRSHIGPYRLVAELGRGGMGVVYKAIDTHLDRTIALKLIRSSLADPDSGARERFLREAKAAAAVKHDHIVTVYHAGEIEGTPFLAMELLEGLPLDQWLSAQGRPPLAEALRIAQQTAEALAAAHARGLVHRDIKPSNLWLEAATGRVKVLDFGLAGSRAIPVEPLDSEEGPPITQTRAVIGTPGFMAPEQARGEGVDQRADLFSLGCVLYQMLTGHAAFSGANLRELLLATEQAMPTPIHEFPVRVPARLAALVHQLLAKSPADRPATAAIVARELAIIEDHLRHRSRRRGALLAAGIALVLIATPTAWLVHRRLTRGASSASPPVGDRAAAPGESSVPPAGPFPPLDGDWVQRVAAMNPAEQLQAATEELKRRNPAFAQELTAETENGRLVGVTVPLTGIVDLTPMRAFPHLRKIVAYTPGDPPEGATLADLSPLAGLTLTHLELSGTRVTDLTPLARMPLETLHIIHSPVRDFGPIRALATLTDLRVTGTEFADLALVRDLKRLRILYVPATKITTLEPLRDCGLPLVELDVSVNRSIRDLTPLRGLPLETLEFHYTSVESLESLRGSTIKWLAIAGTPVTDLRPLKELPLETLILGQETSVTDFKVLAETTVERLTGPFEPKRDAALLRSIPRLRRVNDRPLAEFLDMK